MPHLSPLYRFFDGFVCGFRFWPNLFAVLRFWMIFFFGFAVSNTPQCPPPVKFSQRGENKGSKMDLIADDI